MSLFAIATWIAKIISIGNLYFGVRLNVFRLKKRMNFLIIKKKM